MSKKYRFTDTSGGVCGMDAALTLYHGSQFIIEQPSYRKGDRFNDYGLGFYCTESLELAKEWACSTAQNGARPHN